ncbi:hypothetical protein LX32DRAFT_700232 [Colletotrichum zoysiae]|uniref:Uncharacterized protein n=1 Tax=Colletotrichum zoysiae TaxID=1216348 RepID=A0AAD9HUB1_9PEZI|nr:hypothetical protein LX32DRAFT_700232 [Colletotrichum zoysiae]
MASEDGEAKQQLKYRLDKLASAQERAFHSRCLQHSTSKIWTKLFLVRRAHASALILALSGAGYPQNIPMEIRMRSMSDRAKTEERRVTRERRNTSKQGRYGAGPPSLFIRAPRTPNLPISLWLDGQLVLIMLANYLLIQIVY